MANKALISLLAAALFGCGDGCREVQKKLEEIPISSEHMPTMVSETQSRQGPTASIIAPQLYAAGTSLIAKQAAETQEQADEPNAITAPIEGMIAYYEANESPRISFRGHRKITLNTEYERQMKAEVQQILVDNEYLAEHEADGCFDEDTIKALKKFQRKQGLEQDGVIGNSTADALNELSPFEINNDIYTLDEDSICKLSEDDSSLIAEIETALNFHHYANLPVDGELDDATVNAIRLYKRRNAINNSDSIDSAIVSHLSTSSGRRIEKLEESLDALERLGPDTSNHLYVNLPEFQVRFYYQNQLEFQMDIIIGKKGRWKTDIQSGAIEEAKANPWWNVPASIHEEQARALRGNSALRQVTEQLTNSGWQLIRNNPVNGSRFRQRPGPLSPFGRISYDFRGGHGELLHGTAKKYLFGIGRNIRAYSHGCMRLNNEFEVFHTFQRLGLIDSSLDVGEMIEEIGNDGIYRTQEVELVEPVPVNVIYVRAWADEGENSLFMIMPRDVYGYEGSRVGR